MINTVITEKKMAINFQVITFFSSVASGIESPTVAIIKAMAVPMGTPFATNTWITGTIPAAFAYIGTATITAKGTVHQRRCPNILQRNFLERNRASLHQWQYL